MTHATMSRGSSSSLIPISEKTSIEKNNTSHGGKWASELEGNREIRESLVYLRIQLESLILAQNER